MITRQQVKATTTSVREPARGSDPGGEVFTTVVMNVITTPRGREIETVTYVSPTAPVGSYYGQRIACGWTPVFKG